MSTHSVNVIQISTVLPHANEWLLSLKPKQKNSTPGQLVFLHRTIMIEDEENIWLMPLGSGDVLELKRGTHLTISNAGYKTVHLMSLVCVMHPPGSGFGESETFNEDRDRMKKIPTMFERDWNGDRSRVVNQVHPGCEWVLAGEGTATQKLDGTCCMVRGGQLYKRRELRRGEKVPPLFEQADYDDETIAGGTLEPMSGKCYLPKRTREELPASNQPGSAICRYWNLKIPALGVGALRAVLISGRRHHIPSRIAIRRGTRFSILVK